MEVIDPHVVFAGLVVTAFVATGFDLACAFLMRGERESTPDE